MNKYILFLILLITIILNYYIKNNTIKNNTIKNTTIKNNTIKNTTIKNTTNVIDSNNKNINNTKKKILYYKCDKFMMNRIIKHIFTENNIQKTYDYNSAWKLFMPCTYNNVEVELNKIKNIKNKLIFGVHGCDLIVSKNNVWKLLENRFGRNKASKLMPETYILFNEAHMELFKKNYNENDVYIMKKNIQRKQGLLLTSDYNLITNNDDDKFRIVQKYIKDTFMINKRKLNLRVYLLIVVKNNKLISYYYKNGKCIYTNKDYTNSLDLEENITSLNMDINIYQKNPFDLFELAQYLSPEKYVLLLNNIKNNLINLEKSYKSTLLKLNKNNNNNVHFQLFGLDYIFTKNLDVYLLELNKGPDMSSKNEKDYILKNRVYEDLFSLVELIDNTSQNMFEKIQ